MLVVGMVFVVEDGVILSIGVVDLIEGDVVIPAQADKNINKMIVVTKSKISCGEQTASLKCLICFNVSRAALQYISRLD